MNGSAVPSGSGCGNGKSISGDASVLARNEVIVPSSGLRGEGGSTSGGVGEGGDEGEGEAEGDGGNTGLTPIASSSMGLSPAFGATSHNTRRQQRSLFPGSSTDRDHSSDGHGAKRSFTSSSSSSHPAPVSTASADAAATTTAASNGHWRQAYPSVGLLDVPAVSNAAEGRGQGHGGQAMSHHPPPESSESPLVP